MGMGGTLEYFSDMFSGGHTHNKKKKKQLQTVELKVSMDCDGCELKVRKALSSMRGVKSVEINRKQSKVTVKGYVEANKVLKKAKSTGKKAEIWPYIPYNLVTLPYTAGAYDKRAPPGYVRYVETTTSDSTHGGGTRQDDQITNMFSDENPNSCSVIYVETTSDSAHGGGTRQDDQITNMFSDENPNSCSIMTEDVSDQSKESTGFQNRSCKVFEIEEKKKLAKRLERIIPQSNTTSSQNFGTTNLENSESQRTVRPSKITEYKKLKDRNQTCSENEVRFQLFGYEITGRSDNAHSVKSRMDDNTSKQHRINKSFDGLQFESNRDQHYTYTQMLEGDCPEWVLEKQIINAENAMEQPQNCPLNREIATEMDDLAKISKLVEHTAYTSLLNF